MIVKNQGNNPNLTQNLHYLTQFDLTCPFLTPTVLFLTHLSRPDLIILGWYDRTCPKIKQPVSNVSQTKFQTWLDHESSLDFNIILNLFVRARVIMEQLPFIIPFQLRVQAFRKFIESERESEGLNRDDSPTQHVIIKVNITKDKNLFKKMYIQRLKRNIRLSYTENSIFWKKFEKL